MSDIDACHLADLFLRRVELSRDRPALWFVRDGEYVSNTWSELAGAVETRAALFHFVGDLEPGDRVAQVSENRVEWIVADLAAALAGLVHVPLHVSLSPQQMAAQLADCQAHTVIVATHEKIETLKRALDRHPDGRLRAATKGDVRRSFWAHDPPASEVGLAEIVDPAWDKGGRLPLEVLNRERSADELATILYTSGTTGEPKGVMLTHGNLVSNARATAAAFDTTAEDIRLCWLPLSHVLARTADLYTWIVRGSQLALAESRETILKNCGQIRPTLITGVPYFFDKVRQHLVESGQADTPGALRELLGGAIRLCCSGGAPLSNATAQFYADRDVPLVQGYGLTETSPVITASTRTRNKLGSVGRPIHDVEVRIADDGEVLTRGPHVMPGYWRRPEETARVLQDGWFHTGDLGRLDEEGFLFITGRKKELIVTSGGKKVAPSYVEGLLTEHPLIAQAIVVGEGRKFLAALLVPRPEALRAEIIARHIPVGSREEALRHPQVLALYRAAIDQQLVGLSHCEQVGTFALLDHGFTPERGEMTHSLKLRRQAILDNHAALIDAIYASAAQEAVACSNPA